MRGFETGRRLGEGIGEDEYDCNKKKEKKKKKKGEGY